MQKWPNLPKQFNITGEFDELGAYNFPGVISAIDGCYIPNEAILTTIETNHSLICS